MKQETKDLIQWIKDVIANCPYLAMPDIMRADSDEKIEDAINFLNSLPEFESHLCRGGYIQDANGIPCCDGDLIINESILDREKQKGVLYWSKNDSRFYCKNDDGLINSLSINFTKVE